MSSRYSCSGCGNSWARPSDLTQHYIKTKNPKCKSAGESEFTDFIRPSRSFPRRPRAFLRTSPLQPSDDGREDGDEEEIEPQHFTGDFFGEDYTEQDFPGFPDTLNSDDEEEAYDNVNSSLQAPELETTWEPPRAIIPEPVAASMEVDDETLSPLRRPPNVPFRKLPAHREGIHVDSFGGKAGAPIPGATPHSCYDLSSGFEHYQSNITGSKENKWAPFSSRLDWEVAHWAKMRGCGSTAFDDLLSIKGVDEILGLSFRNSAELNCIIDNNLPSRRPEFSREEVIIAGQAFDLYKRDIIECIRALYGSAEHSPYLCFVPERHYADADKTIRLYHDFNTGKWWWATQKAVEKDKPGATIIPVIISSDKTQVTLFRNKSAYPVYLTIGNLPKEIRRKPSHQGQILLAYLPTTRLDHIKNKAARRRTVSNLFHACMSHLVAPLKEAGKEGVVLQSGDGVKRRCHPILAAYVGDYPEQMLVTTGYYGDCPCCETPKNELGAYPCSFPYREMETAIAASKEIGTDIWVQSCARCNIKPVQHPFWEDLPYAHIFQSITPDVLHQLYQGVMKHLISWLTDVCGAEEFDARVRRLPPNHGIRTFHKGITTLSRISGTEHKQMCTFLLGIVTDIPSLTTQQSHTLLLATRSLLDFLYLARYPIHTNESLQCLDAALESFHAHKHIFVDLQVRENFNFPKLHSLCHYSRAITLYGSTDNYSTETTERLHIDFAKDAYRATNHKDEYAQMTHWLERQEKVMFHSKYIQWRCSARLEPKEADLQPSIGVRQDFPGAQRTLTDLRCVFEQQLTRFPTVKSVSLSKLEDPSLSARGYGATKFSSALARFIVQFRQPDLSPLQVEEYARVVTFPFRTVPVWHAIKFINKDLYGRETLDVVTAHPRRYGANGQVSKAAQFDAALIQVSNEVLASDNEWRPLQNMRAGRIRVIFSLPDKKIDTLFPPDMTPPKHLAYVEWYTKFTRDPDSYSGLHRIKKQVIQGTSAAAVIPVDLIKRSLQLYPKWGGPVPPEWTCETILDECDTFYISPFKDSRTYINLA